LILERTSIQKASCAQKDRCFLPVAHNFAWKDILAPRLPPSLYGPRCQNDLQINSNIRIQQGIKIYSI
jgi:hypothetical protein